MRKAVTCVAIIIAALTALAAILPATTAQEDDVVSAGAGFVGSWHAGFEIDGNTQASNLTTFTSDGIFLASNSPSSPAGEAFDTDVVLHSSSHGVWESAGENSIDITFVILLSDLEGNELGTRTIHGTLELDASGNAWSGDYTATIADPSGEVIRESEGFVEAERITVEPAEPLATPAS